MTTWFKSFRDVLAKWRRRTRAERILLLEAFLLLGVARLAVLALPFKWLAVSLGRHMHEADARISASDLHLARSVGQAICAAANYTPWESVCLPQAVAAQWMLKRRHIARGSDNCASASADPAFAESAVLLPRRRRPPVWWLLLPGLHVLVLLEGIP